MGESGKKASCRPVHVQDMFVSFNFFDANICHMPTNLAALKMQSTFVLNFLEGR